MDDNEGVQRLAGNSDAAGLDKSRTVRSLIRGLKLLELVNTAGGVRPADAARSLSLPRPTAHRILETLEEMGYVCRSPTDNRFFVTIDAMRLSGGYNRGAELTRIAGPVLGSLLDEIVWPVDVTTYHDGMMVVVESTQARSPFATDHVMLGRSIPLLCSASGQAYLAFCPDAERVGIVERLRENDDPADARFLDSGTLEQLIDKCRADGYSLQVGDAYSSRRSSIAVPILRRGSAHGCLSVTWSTSAMRPERAIDKFFPCLREAADRISGNDGGRS